MSEPEDDFATMFEASLKAKQFERGQTIEGTIVAMGHDVALVDVGGKSEAQLDMQSLHRARDRLVGERTALINQLRAFLLERGITYDHSLMHRDFEPYYVRVGDSWTPIDYDKPAREWMKPLQRGEETDLIEIPANWYLDDLPLMMFIKGSPNSHGFVNPRDIEQMWRDQFDWVYREMDYAVFPITIHPDVSGRPQNLLMLERLLDHIAGHEGVEFAFMEDVARDFAARRPRQKG